MLRSLVRLSSSVNKINPSTIELANGLLDSKRHALAKAITLIESSKAEHKIQADLLMAHLSLNKLPSTSNKKTIRIGVAGPPGAGKSTFIEQLGIRYINGGRKVAVIPVDPSSHISGGSILGDKTRMEFLSRSLDAYVRASPTRGVLGGIAEHTADVIFLCESAGYDVVIVESVGLGQSEVDIDTAVDILLLLVPPGGGDSLQAAKKGIMEAADLILVNKADGSLLETARHTKADYAGTIQFIRQKHIDWKAKVLMISAHSGLNMDKVEQEIQSYHDIMINNGNLMKKRVEQTKFWMKGHFRRLVFAQVENSDKYKEEVPNILDGIENDRFTARVAAAKLFEHCTQNNKQ